MLHFVVNEGEGLQLLTRQEVKCDRLVLKTLRPNFRDLAHTDVDIVDLILQFEAVNLERGVGQQVLDEVGKTRPVGLHLRKDFHLTRVQRTEFLRQKQMEVSTHNCQRRLEFVRGGGQSITAATAMLIAKDLEFLPDGSNIRWLHGNGSIPLPQRS